MGLHKLMRLKHDYNIPLIRQFYSTLAFKKDEEHTMMWMTGTTPCEANFHRLAELLRYPFHVGHRLHGPNRPDKDLLYDLYSENGEVGTITCLLQLYDQLLRFFQDNIAPSGGNRDAICGALVRLLALAGECDEDGENKDYTLDVMDYIFHEIHDEMVSRTTMPYAPYIQLLIDNTVVTEDLSEYPRVDHKVKNTYVKRKTAAPPAPHVESFMGYAHASGTALGRTTASPLSQKEVKKLNWFQRHVLCMNIQIHKENFKASRERADIQHTQAVILHKLSGDQGSPRPPIHPTYNNWNSSQVHWSEIEQSLMRSSISRDTPPTAEDSEDEYDLGSN
jgi:hypothetical protein